jgi:hypothetical protein
MTPERGSHLEVTTRLALVSDTGTAPGMGLASRTRAVAACGPVAATGRMMRCQFLPGMCLRTWFP